MPIIGFNFRSISSSSDEMKDTGKEINVNSSPKIDSVEKKDLDMPGMDNVVSVKFTFRTIYEPKIGDIEITGEILYKTIDAKATVKLWKDKKTVEKDMYLDVTNTILRKCLSKAVMLADELRLPQPVSFPMVVPQEDKK